MTRNGWLLIGGSIMGLWLLMPMLFATAGPSQIPSLQAVRQNSARSADW